MLMSYMFPEEPEEADLVFGEAMVQPTLNWLDKLDYGNFVGNLALRDQLQIAATCRHLRGLDLSLFISHGTIDLSRRLKYAERQAVSDPFFKRILVHAGSLLSRQGLATPVGDVVTSIVIRDCQNLTHVSLKGIAANCPALTALDCRESWITDEALKAIASKCHSLTSLQAFYCYRITDDGLSAVAVNCPNLTFLDVQCCWYLTDKGINAIAANCPALTSLNVFGLRYTTEESVKAILKSCPKLTTFHGRLGRITNDRKKIATIAARVLTQES